MTALVFLYLSFIFKLFYLSLSPTSHIYPTDKSNIRCHSSMSSRNQAFKPMLVWSSNSSSLLLPLPPTAPEGDLRKTRGVSVHHRCEFAEDGEHQAPRTELLSAGEVGGLNQLRSPWRHLMTINTYGQIKTNLLGG